MTRLRLLGTIALGSVGGMASSAPVARPPATFGACAFTTVKAVEQRLEDGATGRPVPNSGSQVELADGVMGVSYDQVPAIAGSRRGDHAMVCLVDIPRHCPRSDGRGRWYTTTNLRTLESWTLPDAEHQCGGA
ncbi:hypothetical protein [Sphingomonas bacterium]|uniref:hypothetical protein n=1 Tax=Sphingomonas bacterium TaxID=1895847 RepID=UPI001576A333|nr:hypothetical protein [Sphingomonas bacterium]